MTALWGSKLALQAAGVWSVIEKFRRPAAVPGGGREKQLQILRRSAPLDDSSVWEMSMRDWSFSCPYIASLLTICAPSTESIREKQLQILRRYAPLDDSSVWEMSMRDCSFSCPYIASLLTICAPSTG
jgi:hypothetical protein